MTNRGKNRISVAGAGHSEHQHQSSLITWARDSARIQTDPAKQGALNWLHSIPNAAAGRKGFHNKRARAAVAAGLKPDRKDILPPLQVLRMIDEGLTKGVLDVRLDYVVRDAAGVIIKPGLIAEFKKPGEDLTTDQKRYAAFARSQGYDVFIWFGWERAAIDIAVYLRLEVFAPVMFEVAPGRLRVIKTLEQIESLNL
jgi:hypothetical protein